MLRDLHVRNLAVLAEASVRFGEGLNVLSGETGAGKSMVVDALALLAGGRADSSLIRTGADRLQVHGVFEPTGTGWREVLDEAGITADGNEIVIRREVHAQGRNRIFVEDQPVTQRLLTQLAPYLMTLHGQRDELGLAQPERQREWLDRVGGAEAAELLTRVEGSYRSYLELSARLEQLSGDDRTRLERIDLLRFQLREIDAVDPVEDEEIELRRDREQLRHAEAILAGLSGGLEAISEGEGAALERIEESRRQLESLQRWLPEAAGWLSEIEEARVLLQDVGESVSRQLSATELDPGRLDQVEERLVELERLFRRFGQGTREVLEYRHQARTELGGLEIDEEGRAALESEVAEALDRYREEALKLSTARQRWGRELAERVQAELSDLALDRARFGSRLERRSRAGSALVLDDEPVEFGSWGFDQVVFEFAANPGESSRPLARVASGGELARVYLALQVALRGDGTAHRATMVFDEVDAGIGGREAAAVGRKLRRLASGGQILAVTHLPQVASCGHQHFRIRKQVEQGRTFVEVSPLDSEARVAEVARMLAGDEITDLSRSHAEELIGAGAVE